MDSVAFITCVKRWETYEACRASVGQLEPGGFEVETDPVDNSTHNYSCAQALNLAWERAQSSLLVFCHEDVEFPRDWLLKVRASLDLLTSEKREWAVLGPMGRVDKRFYGHALDGTGEPSFFGPLPAQVETLDEFCLLVPRALELRFDEQLGGYHLYGVDLCIQAIESDAACYAVDAPCQHNSTTRHRPREYHDIKKKLQRKWRFRRRKIGRSVGTTCGRIRFGIFEGWF